VKPNPATTQVAWKRLDARIHLARDPVVVASRQLNLVLDLFELGLQLSEIGIRLQGGIGFSDREKAPERALHPLLGGDLAGHRIGGEALCPLIGQVFENGVLVRGVAFDRLDQVGDEVGAAPQLDIDTAPPLLQHAPRPYQTVVGEHDIKRRGDSERADDVTGTPEMHEYPRLAPSDRSHEPAPCGLRRARSL